MSHSRERAVCSTDNGVGHERYELYRSAFSWISKSIEAGYYLEAISLIESLICDRLESHLSLLLNENCGFKTLGFLIRKIRQYEVDEDLRAVVAELDFWRKARNKAAHEMVKIEQGIQISWQERVEINKKVAQDGLQLVRRIDNKTRQIRRANIS